MDNDTTDFGYQKVDETEKAKRVAGVFDSVATRYDMMNDIMSGGMHRLWKLFTISRCDAREGSKILDIAGGTGDLARAFAKRVGKTGEIWLTDINNSMLTIGRDRLVDSGHIMPACQCDAEKLPFPDNYFDIVSVAFGLRNMTHKGAALAEMRRVIKPGGRVAILEFSQVCKPLAPLYDFYSFQIIPKIGRLFVKDETSYRYLVESIRVHPDQETLKGLMESAGLERVEYYNLTFGVVALHIGYKL